MRRLCTLLGYKSIDVNNFQILRTYMGQPGCFLGMGNTLIFLVLLDEQAVLCTVELGNLVISEVTFAGGFHPF